MDKSTVEIALKNRVVYFGYISAEFFTRTTDALKDIEIKELYKQFKDKIK